MIFDTFLSTEYHVLDFFYDTEDNSAPYFDCRSRSIQVNADSSRIRRGNIGREYSELLEDLKEAQVDKAAERSTDSGVGFEL